MSSRFEIKDNKLYLKTKNRELVVQNNVTPDDLFAIAANATLLALFHKRVCMSGIEYLLCTPLECRIINLRGLGYNNKQIAKYCHVRLSTVYRNIKRIEAKLANFYRQNTPAKPAQKSKKPGLMYRKVVIETIPFSDPRLVGFDHLEPDESEFEPSDNGQASDEIYRSLEMQTRVEDTEVYHLFDGQPRQQELLRLLAQGLSRQECARQMGVSLQEIHQKVGRMKKTARDIYEKTVRHK